MCYAGFKDHDSLFPPSTRVLVDHADELGARSDGTGTIRFSYDERLPVALVKRIVRTRMREVEARMRR